MIRFNAFLCIVSFRRSSAPSYPERGFSPNSSRTFRLRTRNQLYRGAKHTISYQARPPSSRLFPSVTYGLLRSLLTLGLVSVTSFLLLYRLCASHKADWIALFSGHLTICFTFHSTVAIRTTLHTLTLRGIYVYPD